MYFIAWRNRINSTRVVSIVELHGRNSTRSWRESAIKPTNPLRVLLHALAKQQLQVSQVFHLDESIQKRIKELLLPLNTKPNIMVSVRAVSSLKDLIDTTTNIGGATTDIGGGGGELSTASSPRLPFVRLHRRNCVQPRQTNPN
jgi:hypothetical protein